MNKVFYPLLIFLLIMAASCNDPSPLEDEGRDLLEAYGEFRSDTLYAISDTFIVTGKVSTAFSQKLLLGSYAGFETRFLLQFTTLPPDTIVMDSLKLLISSASEYGTDNKTINGTVYRVKEPWEETVNNNPDWDYKNNIDYTPGTTTQFSFGELDTTLYTDFSINLPKELVKIWQDTTSGEQNYGVLLDFNSSGIIREFSSREGFFSSRRPRIVYVYHFAENDSTIRDTVVASRDASLIDFPGDFDQSKLFVTSGYTAHAFFQFNLDSIPRTASLSSASFYFSQDSANSIINTNKSQNIYIRNVITEYDQLPSFEIDSSFVFSSLRNLVLRDVAGSGLQLEGQSRANAGQYVIQDILNDFVENGSFFVQYANEGEDISVYAIKDSKNPDIELRPRLILEYFINPKGRL